MKHARIAELRPTHGDTAAANARGHRSTPSLQDLMDIPPAVAGVYEMREEEIKRLRSRIYALNKDNHFGWRWRTLIDGEGARALPHAPNLAHPLGYPQLLSGVKSSRP